MFSRDVSFSGNDHYYCDLCYLALTDSYMKRVCIDRIDVWSCCVKVPIQPCLPNSDDDGGEKLGCGQSPAGRNPANKIVSCMHLNERVRGPDCRQRVEPRLM